MRISDKINKLLTSFDFQNEENNRLAGIITTIAGVIAAGLSILLVFRVVNREYHYFFFFGMTIAFQILSIYLVRKKELDKAGNIVIWTIMILLLGLAYRDKGALDPAINGIPGLLIIISLLKKNKDFIFHILLVFFLFNLLAAAEVMGFYTPLGKNNIELSDLIDLNVVLIITSVIIRILTLSLIKSMKRTRHQAEQLIKSENRFRVLLATANEGILVLDPSGAVTFANQKISEITGYSVNELLSMNVEELVAEEDLEDHYRKLRQRELRLRAVFERKMRRRDGEIILAEISASPVLDEAGNYQGFFSMITDITDRKKAESALREAKEKAEMMDQLKSNFLAQMSHEIRTPVNTILSFTSLIKSELESTMTEDMAQGFRIIDGGGRRLIRTIDMILTMSQLQAGSYETHPPELNLYVDILCSLCEEFQTPARVKNLGLKITRKTGSLMVTADQYSLTQLFQNLIDNAVKYTKQGTVDIIIYQDEDSRICVDIKDTGIGISDDYLKNIFNPFSQEDTGYTRKFEGNGLGLALVKKYAEINNLDISVKSRKNEGTTFTVMFCASGFAGKQN